MRSGGILVWANIRDVGRCRDCRQQIVWRINSKTGRSLPFDPHAFVLHTERDEERGITLELLSGDNLHLVTCRNRRMAPPQTDADRYAERMRRGR